MLQSVRYGPILAVPLAAQRVHAGFPSPADEVLEDAVDVGRMVVWNPIATFLWRVAGESMIEAGIHDGDTLVVDRSLAVRDGDVVVAVVDDGPVVKRYLQPRGEPARLVNANAAIAPFRVDETAQIAIWGVVTWNLHRLREGGGR